MILPTPKAYDREARSCRIPQELTVFAKGEFSRLGADMFRMFFETAAEVSENGFVEFVYDEELEAKAEIYKMIITEDKVKVLFRDARGAVNGAASVIQLINGGALECGTITDYPDCEYRSFMVDMARGVPALADVQRTVCYMALAKYNRLLKIEAALFHGGRFG